MSVHLQDSLVLTLAITDPRLDDEERERMAQTLYRQLHDADGELGQVRRERVAALSGAKSATTTIIGVLTAVLSTASLKAFFSYLTERLRGHEVTLEMEVNGRKIKIAAKSASDLMAAGDTAAALLAVKE